MSPFAIAQRVPGGTIRPFLSKFGRRFRSSVSRSTRSLSELGMSSITPSMQDVMKSPSEAKLSLRCSMAARRAGRARAWAGLLVLGGGSGLGAAVDAAAGQGPKAGSAAAASKAAASFFAFFFCFLKEVCCARVGSGMALGGVLSTSRFLLDGENHTSEVSVEESSVARKRVWTYERTPQRTSANLYRLVRL